MTGASHVFSRAEVPVWGFHEVGRGAQGASRVAPGKLGFHGRGEGNASLLSSHGSKRPEQPHQKGKTAAGTAQSHGTVKRSLITDSNAIEAQAVMTVVGQILEEKMELHHGPYSPVLNGYKAELQAPLGPPYCYHRFLSY